MVKHLLFWTQSDSQICLGHAIWLLETIIHIYHPRTERERERHRERERWDQFNLSLAIHDFHKDMDEIFLIVSNTKSKEFLSR